MPEPGARFQTAAAEAEPPPRNLSELLERPDEPAVQRTWADEALDAAGLRRVASKHVTLYTDVAPDPAVDGLPAIFDKAVPQWAAYFDIPPEETADWRLNAFLMDSREPFAALDMLPGEREIVTGFATKDNLWITEQSTPYYRRHLWLHEGTHAFMHAFLNRASPGWYLEGLAELLGTHRLEDGKLVIGIMPRSSAEVPALGRVELVQQDVDKSRVHAIEDIMQLDNRRALPADAYAWCWALASFLDSHPRYRDRFRALGRTGVDAGFDESFLAAYASDWHEMQAEWAIFATTLDYNHQIEPTVLDFEPGHERPGDGQPATVQIRADRGWQNSGILLEAGTTYRIAARGRYQVDNEPEPWWCEPNGVTIHYNRGQPLGILLAALLVRTPDGQPQASSFLRPVAVGLEATVTPERSGTLYLRINDSPGSLHNNHGELTIEVVRN
jgi:hypothetical protein